MPKKEVRCIVCGLEVTREGEAGDIWLREYRMVYRTSAGTYLSDAAVRRHEGDEASFQVPLLNSNAGNGQSVASINVPILQEKDGCFGFVMHNACWAVFQIRAGSTSIDLQRLVEVFESVSRIKGPPQLCCYAWYHEYENIISFDYILWPWERRCWSPKPLSPEFIRAISRSPLSTVNPNVSGITSSWSTAFEKAAVKRHGSADNDCFATLPFEIVEEIAFYLSTATVLKTRLASRTFAQLFYSQTFWASRFRSNGERGFLFEAWNKTGSRDWRQFYRQTRDIAATHPFLHNRQRIWCLAGSLWEKLVLTPVQPLTRVPADQHLLGRRKGEVYGDLTVGKFLNKRASTQKIVPQKTEVPTDTHRIGISIVYDGPVTYVAGIHLFHGANDNDIRLGYITVPETTLFSNFTSLKGFIVAVGSSGIHALRIVHGENDTLSPWLGDPLDGAITRRLVFIDQISALSAGFDGYKMIYLSAWGRRAPAPEGLKQLDLIRNRLLWCPELPGPDMNLNETSVFGKLESSAKKFHPAMWTSFGGPGGANLRFLTSVTVIIDGDIMTNVMFQYSTGNISSSRTIMMLGRRGSEDSDVAPFSIHGAAGEFITTIEVETDPRWSPNTPTGLLITTNWGRRCSASRNQLDPKRTLLQTVRGTIPTGLYATQVCATYLF
ncbi:hypothetical protein BJX66DRAFT_189107 [Aspergillus keveii]|uniref:F-box domain-containing protein n=1 Tax=Aspergillus keveii TaxID=714993 RepID=A0ABR4G7U4_9EURO